MREAIVLPFPGDSSVERRPAHRRAEPEWFPLERRIDLEPFPGERRVVHPESLPGERRVQAEPMPATERRRYVLPLAMLILVAIMGLLVLVESKTSLLQAWYFGRWSSTLRYSIEPGPSTGVVFPTAGPFDERRGYTHIPEFSRRLQERGFRITEQARQTPELQQLIRSGIAPPFREAPLTGAVIRDSHRKLLFDPTAGEVWTFQSYGGIPPLLVNSLLFIENRSIGDRDWPRANPAVDWARTAKAAMLYTGRKLGLPWPLEGGSTLATQLEKFHHSPGGRTDAPRDKLHQVVGASLLAYHKGPDTREVREQIILDYLNTMPLGAAPGVGEVNGLADGLRTWFGLNPGETFATLQQPDATPAKARAYKHVLALLYAVHAPTFYLTKDRPALQARVEAYAGLLRAAGILDAQLFTLMQGLPLDFASPQPADEPPRFVERKAANATREELQKLLNVQSLYRLDRLDLHVDSTIDSALQDQVTRLLRRLESPQFVTANGLRETHLLDRGDPSRVTYSLLLVESRPEGNLVRVHADTLDAPFDVNGGMKLELGSTAKLRTLAHYLELVSQLHQELSSLDAGTLAGRAAHARDPITLWAAMTLLAEPRLNLETFLARSLERTYSANPDEAFYTGAGTHHFRNFEPEDDEKTLTIREALVRSTNLVFIRLMRDVVRFHEVRLPYDSDAVLEDPYNAQRRRFLTGIAAAEERQTHTSGAWLLSTHNRDAQEMRLRTRIERDAFERMTPYWRKLGFPFETLVASYATAIGSSADRPAALADLMGIIVNDGRRRPMIDVHRLSFADGTPYQTVFERTVSPGEQVMSAPIARLLRTVLSEVVESGTARRVNHAFVDPTGSLLPVGGKTGSGDNRLEAFDREGHLISSQPVSRTATFVFYIGDRWFGVITASVSGPQSAGYTFTSSLPLTVLKLLAPTLNAAIARDPIPARPALAATAAPSPMADPPVVTAAPSPALDAPVATAAPSPMADPPVVTAAPDPAADAPVED